MDKQKLQCWMLYMAYLGHGHLSIQYYLIDNGGDSRSRRGSAKVS
jgi:hypothetical protein